MATRISEPARDIEVVHETDILVVGSGPGGLSAALAAASRPTIVAEDKSRRADLETWRIGSIPRII